MKASAPTSSPSPARPRSSGLGRTFSLFVTLACAGLMTKGVRAQDMQLDVGVRSTVVNRLVASPGHAPMQDAGERGKSYGIVSVQRVPSLDRLVKPVDEGAILQLLSYELNQHGYHLPPRGQNPEIVLVVYYGRGFLSNPYQVAGGRTETPSAAASVSGSGGDQVGGPSVSITGTPNQLFREKSPGFEQKLQRAGYEKLYIRVSAWQFPTDPKAKVRQLWNTTMVVDDPDHRDLNAVAEKMLEAGVAFFGRNIAEEEVDVYKPLPEGRVNVGTPQVVEPKSK